MATQIPERIATLPEPPYKGIDLGAVFIAKAEGFRYALKYSFSPTVNAIADGMNAISLEVSQAALEVETDKNTAKAQANLATQKASEASASATSALNSKNTTQQLLTQTEDLIESLVIPVAATYTYTEIDNNFSSEFEEFINFKLGE